MVVYCVPCTCEQAYIEKTIQRLKSRMKEHKDAYNQGQVEKSMIAEHAWRHDRSVTSMRQRRQLPPRYLALLKTYTNYVVAKFLFVSHNSW